MPTAHHQRLLFLGVSAVVGLVLGIQTCRLLPLYFFPSVRSGVQKTLIAIADHEGWLLSEMELRIVTAREITFIHHEHRRGTDRLTCLTASIGTFTPEPCVKN